MATKTTSAPAKSEAPERQPPAGAPTRSTPFGGLADFSTMRDEMERMMGQFFGNDWMQGMSRLHPLMMDWPALARAMPFQALGATARAAMSETDGEYELTVELPGMDEKDVELTLSDNSLMLEAEKTEERKSGEKDVHFTERSYGRIRRRFPLPPGVDAAAMKARFAKGVLTVTLPKTEAAKSSPRRIPVSGG